MTMQQAVDAVNRRDRAGWLDCYSPDVEWEIVAGDTWRGHRGLAAMWDRMVQGGEADLRQITVSVGREGHVAAVVSHDGTADSIVCCRLDDDGRIAHGRSYRAGDPPPTPVQTAINRHVVTWNAHDERVWLAGHNPDMRLETPVGGPATIGGQAADWESNRRLHPATRLRVCATVARGDEAAAHMRVQHEVGEWHDFVAVWTVDRIGRLASCVVYDDGR